MAWCLVGLCLRQQKQHPGQDGTQPHLHSGHVP